MKETQHFLKSTHLANERAVWVREPGNRASNVTVFLDAELYRDRVGAISIIDALESQGDIDSSLFVFVSVESAASRWVECPCYSPFARFIEEELFPWLERAYPSALEAQERVIVGLSYTGLTAAYVSMMYPSRFTKVIAQSASFWSNDCWIMDYFETLDPKPKTEFYLDVGLRETQENILHKEDVFQAVSQIEGVKRFRDALLRHGYQPHYVEFDGGHDFAAWSLTLPDALRWALPSTRNEPDPANAAASHR
ncbi:esterase family protein [Methylosinus sporium]|uniref:Esterase family protein n=1 Tax=Methylosinus sporium TaxID=428 RepID=A0A549SUS2_METSR|nr:MULTISPECIES: alpha/beta hydrolase-fold protein [Methylosinus]MBU3890249.1 esterase family protein [Methylosinus sp. KRF6]TRL33386.1 esterase family protein [Methylosinus sporium]